MIFSKDKKPTTTGYYWAIYKGRHVVCDVFKYTRGRTLYIHHTDSRSDRLLSQVHNLSFGDRIQVPTVESPVMEGATHDPR